MTNRELIKTAMPLSSLSESEWNEIIAFQDKATGSLLSALETLISNQARIEIFSCYKDYYGDRLEESVPENSIALI